MSKSKAKPTPKRPARPAAKVTPTTPVELAEAIIEKAGAKEALDEWRNVPARLGSGSGSLASGGSFFLTRFSRNYPEINAMFRNSWIARKTIDTPASDMTKNWLQLHTEMKAPDIDDFEFVVSSTNTKARTREGLAWGNLFGGATGLMVIEGHDDLEEPLDLDSIELGSYKGLMIFDRWQGVSPNMTLNTDITRPVDYGLPVSYQVRPAAGAPFNVHASRMLRFTGRQLPYWERQAEQYWGISEFELLFSDLQKRNNLSWSLVSLVFRANIFGLAIKDLAQMLALAPQGQQDRLEATLSNINEIMSSMGFVIMPEGATMSNFTASFSGLPELYESYMLDICGCVEMPMTKLFGRTPTGLGQTGDADLQNYDDSIGTKQEERLRPELNKLLPVIAMSTWGQVPKDLWKWRFRPQRTLSNKDRAELADKKSRLVFDAIDKRVIPPRTGLLELRDMSEEVGMWSNITDDVIQDAPDTIEPLGGEFGLGDNVVLPGEDPNNSDAGKEQPNKGAGSGASEQPKKKAA